MFSAMLVLSIRPIHQKSSYHRFPGLMCPSVHVWENGRPISNVNAKLCETCSEGYLTVSRCDRRLSVVCVTCIIVKKFSKVFRCFLFVFCLFSCLFSVVFLLHNSVVHCCVCFFCCYQSVFHVFSGVFHLLSAVLWCFLLYNNGESRPVIWQ